MRAGLGGIQDIDTAQILPWGPRDRLEVELTAVNSASPQPTITELSDSIALSGQQVPVLLRPAQERDGAFEVVYGRRRILACRALGIPVKALIRTLDDAAALKAKGLENASRIELSFYERARFAQDILAQGFTRSDAIEALAISKNTLSQLERITRLVPVSVGDGIGAAPGAGRPKWTALAELFEKGGLDEAGALALLSASDPDCTSDARLEALLAIKTRRGPQERTAQTREPIPGVSIKNGRSALQVSVTKRGDSKDFADWLDLHLEGLIKDSFERFQSENPEGQGG